MTVDLSRIESFDWDDGNSRKSADKHGVVQIEAEQVFVNRPLIVTEDVRHSGDEPRHHALGQTGDGRLLHVTFTLRSDGSRIRIISARPMNRKERPIYERAKHDEGSEEKA
jgi:uncharacterized DUF497 family protein